MGTDSISYLVLTSGNVNKFEKAREIANDKFEWKQKNINYLGNKSWIPIKLLKD